jgi:hypothetical protein
MILQDASPGDIFRSSMGTARYVVVSANDHDMSFAWQDYRGKALIRTELYDSIMKWATHIRTSEETKEFVLAEPIFLGEVVRIRGDSANFVVVGLGRKDARVYLHREGSTKSFGWHPERLCIRKGDKPDMQEYASGSSTLSNVPVRTYTSYNE